MKELICIVCPKGCHLKVEQSGPEEYQIKGYSCPRGLEYGKKEMTNPTRVITSTVRITGASHKRLPVKTAGEIPKGKIIEAMRLLDKIEVASPVTCGQVILPDILGTGVPFVATKSM